MDAQFDPLLLVLYGTLVTFLVDMVPKATSRAKVALSIGLAGVCVFSTGTDAVATLLKVESTIGTLLLTSLTLAEIGRAHV